MHQILGLFIPIIALSIPLTAVIGRTIVAPMLAARHRPADDHRVQMLEQRLALMEQNMEAMERSMAQISEVAEFHRQLAMPAAGSAATPPQA